MSATLLDRIVDYLRRTPADLGAVASHFGMTPTEAHGALLNLERAGRARCGRYLLWEPCDDTTRAADIGNFSMDELTALANASVALGRAVQILQSRFGKRDSAILSCKATKATLREIYDSETSEEERIAITAHLWAQYGEGK